RSAGLPHSIEHARERRAEHLLVAELDCRLQLVVELVERAHVQIAHVQLTLAEDPHDHDDVPPISFGAAPAPTSPLSLDNSNSTSDDELIRSSSVWMSSEGPVAVASSSAPEASSSSIAAPRACICAVLSCARWIARPTSPISSETPANASPIFVCASAAV